MSSTAPTHCVALAQEPVVRHPLVVEHARQVAAARVGVEHHDDVVGPGPLRHLDRGGDGHAAGSTDQDALDLADATGGEEALLVADRDHLVVELGLPRGREEVLADTLDQVGPAGAAREHRALRVGGDDLDRRVLLLEVARRAGERAARAGAGDEVGDAPGRLAPQLGSGRLARGRRGCSGWRTGWGGTRRSSSVSRSATL